MSKKKSLGSSPIGFHADSTLGFIPDLGVSKAKKSNTSSTQSHMQSIKERFDKNRSKQEEKNEKPEKKIVSYNLEITLVERVKTLADKKEMYYSSLVSSALRQWIANNS